MGSILKISHFIKNHDILLFGIADLKDCHPPTRRNGQPFPRAVSFAIPMNPKIMAGIKNRPTQAYAQEYRKVNDKIDTISIKIEN